MMVLPQLHGVMIQKLLHDYTDGVGAFLGIAKAITGAELGADSEVPHFKDLYH